MKICVTVVIQVVFVGSFLGWAYYLKRSSPNRDDAKLEEIKTEIVKLPLHPSFQKIGEDYSSRHMDAGGTLYYRSNANGESVRAFYATELPKLGWQIDRETNPPFFHKNDLRLRIEYRPDQSDWNYALDVEWKNPNN